MSKNLQGITFGFFENLPEEAKFYVEDILYGNKTTKAKPELPWEDVEASNMTAALSVPAEVSMCTENTAVEMSMHADKAPVEVSMCTDNAAIEVTVDADYSPNKSTSHVTHHSPSPVEIPQKSEVPDRPKEVTVSVATELPPAGSNFGPGGDIVTLPPAPPGIHQHMYPIPVVTGIPPHMIPMVGVYHHQAGMPVNYLPMMPHQGIAMMPSAQDQMILTTEDPHALRNEDMYINNNDKYVENKDKEATKILGGKTYERRNKKRRPANYYENLGRRQPPLDMEMPPMMYNSNLSMIDPSYPPPGQLPHFSPQRHHSGPVPADYHVLATSANQVIVSSVLTSQGAPCSHYVGHIPAYLPQGAPIHLPREPIVIAPAITQQQHTDTPPDIPPTDPSHATNTSLSSEIYTDGRRISPNQFSFGDVEEELNSIGQENNIFQQEQHANNPEQNLDPQQNVDHSKGSVDNPDQNVDHSKPNQDHPEQNPLQPVQNVNSPKQNVSHSLEFKLTEPNDSETEMMHGVTFGDVSTTCSINNIGSESVPAGPTTHDLCLQPVCDSSVTVTIELPCPDSVSSESKAPVSNTTSAHSGDSSSECAPEPPVSPQPADTTQNQNNNALPEDQLKPNETPPSSPPESGTPAPAKTLSWASLFHSTTTAAAATVIYNQSSSPISEDKLVPRKDMEKLPETVTADKDKVVEQLGALVKDYTLSYKSVAIQPRGLVNRGNWCYVNATLQALLACPVFYNLIKYLPSYPSLVRGPSSTPVLDSIVEFVNEFNPMPLVKPLEKNNKGKGNIKYDLPTGPTFEPTYVYKMLQVMKYDGFKGGRQEDAEEFLSCLLNGLHDEMVAAMKIEHAKNPDRDNDMSEVTTNGNGDLSDDLSQDEEVDDAGWEQVGPKNKSVVTRSATVDKSPVSDIFQGQIRNILNRPGMKESATLQPFFTLQLEIQSEKVRTVQEALDSLVSKEMLQDFTCSKTKMEIDASRRTMLEHLPPVLLLHFKCFVYDKNGGCQKVVKQLDFTSVLEIHKDLISPTARSHFPASQRKYKLFAVLKHVGVRAAGGHYVADVYHKHLGEWVHYDDNNVHVVTMPQVFMFRHPRVPYLLFYRRDDLR